MLNLKTENKITSKTTFIVTAITQEITEIKVLPLAISVALTD